MTISQNDKSANTVNWSKLDFHFLDLGEQRHGNVRAMVSNFLTRVQRCKLRPSDDEELLLGAQHAHLGHRGEGGAPVEDPPGDEAALREAVVDQSQKPRPNVGFHIH